MPDWDTRHRDFEYQVCPACRGHGTKVLHGHAFTGDELAELGPEFVEDMLDGTYDTECPCCHGLRVATEAMIEDWQEAVQEQRTMDRESGVYPYL